MRNEMNDGKVKMIIKNVKGMKVMIKNMKRVKANE
jgi:hypothetical protein